MCIRIEETVEITSVYISSVKLLLHSIVYIRYELEPSNGAVHCVPPSQSYIKGASSPSGVWVLSS